MPRKKEVVQVPKGQSVAELQRQIAEKREGAQRLYIEKSKFDRQYETANQEIQALEQEVRERRNEEFLAVLNERLINVLTPEHTRKSCSDENADSSNGCARCKLLTFHRDQYVDPDVTFEFEVINNERGFG